MSNLRTVYSPLGEKFEVSEPNYLDLTRHAGWTDARPHPDDVAAYIAKNGGEAAPAQAYEPAAPEAPEAPAADETTTEVVVEDGAMDAKTEPHHFADMGREEVKDHITNTFPEAVIDGRSGRDALVAQAIELAKA